MLKPDRSIVHEHVAPRFNSTPGTGNHAVAAAAPTSRAATGAVPGSRDVSSHRIHRTAWKDRIAALLGIQARALEALPLPAPDAAGTSGQEAERIRELQRKLQVLQALHHELAQAKTAAESALLSKSQFLATMSHEIRTPLNGILPLLEMVLSGPVPDEQREQLHTIYSSSRHLLRIVNDVLDYSRVESGKVELECDGLNLREVVDHVVKLLERSAQAKGLSIASRFDPNVRLAVRGDALRLRQVLTNLISNAIKFTPRGAIDIEVRKRGESRTHHSIQFSVRDNGIGLSPDAAAKIFQPFGQADASTTRKFGGTGLGLVICRRLVEAMGGQIGVSSQPGCGATFWFTVPLMKAIGDIKAHDPSEDVRAVVLCRDPAIQEHVLSKLRMLKIQAVSADTTLDALRNLRASAGIAIEGQEHIVIVDHKTFHNTIRSLSRTIESEEALGKVRGIVLGVAAKLPEEIERSSRFKVLDREPTEQQIAAVIASFFRPEEEGAEPGAGPVIDIRPRDTLVDLGGRRVLLVDDIQVNRDIGKRVLESMGAAVDLACDGREALQCMLRGAYDIVLMDCQMPDVDGYAATRAQREREYHENLPRLPILAMTANAMPGDREKCLAAGMEDHLAKPLDRRLLSEAIRRWLRDDLASPQAGQDPTAQTADVARHGVAAELPDIRIDALRTLYSGIKEGTSALADRWCGDTRTSMSSLRNAIEFSDVAAALRSARALKSAGALLGIRAFAATAASLEAALEAGMIERMQSQVAAMDAEFERVRLAMLAQLGRA